MNAQEKFIKSRKEFQDNASHRHFVLLEEYTGSKNKVKMSCPQGHEFSITSTSLKQGHGCEECRVAERSRVNGAAFVARIAYLGGTVEGPYVTYSKAVLCKCPLGHSCNPIPQVIRLGYGMCSTCRLNKSKTKEAFYKRSREEGITVKGEYVDSATPILCICPMGHECRPGPNSIREGWGFCVTCAGGDGVLAKERFMKWMSENNYQVLGEYINNATKIKAICPRGHTCFPRPGYISSGKGMCTECSPKSEGEVKINETLKILGVKFNREIRFRYDFELPDHKIIIEADGNQHFMLSGYYMRTPEDLTVSHLRDTLKMLLAKKKGYTIVRIDYTCYKCPVESFVDFIKTMIEIPKESRDPFFYTTPSMYTWVDEILSSS